MNLEDPQTKNSRTKKNLILLGVLVFLLLFPTLPLILYRYGITNSMPTTNVNEFEIYQAEGVSSVAERLHKEKLINSALLFKIHVKLTGVDKNIQAGTYLIPPKSSIADLAQLFQHGRNDITLRYIEGWRVEQLGLYLVEKLENFNYREFVLAASPLEGYLFPDTYVFNRDISHKEVVEIMNATFDQKTQDLLSEEKLGNLGLTEKEAVIVASILEREAVNKNDQRIIAGILLKRLSEGMKLEVDATTQYAVALTRYCRQIACKYNPPQCRSEELIKKCETGLYQKYLGGEVDWWPHDLTLADLETDNSYNTRKNYGLPPSPISSFGLSSLESLMTYEKSPYYFYLTDTEGVTHFSTTLDEHNLNITRYLK